MRCARRVSRLSFACARPCFDSGRDLGMSTDWPAGVSEDLLLRARNGLSKNGMGEEVARETARGAKEEEEEGERARGR